MFNTCARRIGWTVYTCVCVRGAVRGWSYASLHWLLAVDIVYSVCCCYCNNLPPVLYSNSRSLCLSVSTYPILLSYVLITESIHPPHTQPPSRSASLPSLYPTCNGIEWSAMAMACEIEKNKHAGMPSHTMECAFAFAHLLRLQVQTGRRIYIYIYTHIRTREVNLSIMWVSLYLSYTSVLSVAPISTYSFHRCLTDRCWTNETLS